PIQNAFSDRERIVTKAFPLNVLKWVMAAFTALFLLVSAAQAQLMPTNQSELAIEYTHSEKKLDLNCQKFTRCPVVTVENGSCIFWVQ
ncbi:MAG: hypothetical protein LC639_05590, partial [Idiomarina sp.]|nr:hypothetical protein [Idiomarina sp.]